MPQKIVLLGRPNVGKSALFHRLTGRYETVSNYPGTTVEVAQGRMRHRGLEFDVLDTPGLYGFSPIGEDERVSRDVIFSWRPGLIVHVVEAAQLEPSLTLTLQIVETGLPFVLALNMCDELRREGVRLDTKLLESRLCAPVVSTSAVTGEGIAALKEKMAQRCRR